MFYLMLLQIFFLKLDNFLYLGKIKPQCYHYIEPFLGWQIKYYVLLNAQMHYIQLVHALYMDDHTKNENGQQGPTLGKQIIAEET